MDGKTMNLKSFYFQTPKSCILQLIIPYRNELTEQRQGNRQGPPLAKIFLTYHEQKWLDRCPLEYRPLYFWLNMNKIGQKMPFGDDSFVLFKSSNHVNP